MPLLHFPKRFPTVAFGLTLVLATRGLCADTNQPQLLAPQARGIHDQTAAMEQEQGGRWWNRRRTVKTRENPPLLVETPVPDSYPSGPMPQDQEQRQPEQPVAPELRADEWMQPAVTAAAVTAQQEESPEPAAESLFTMPPQPDSGGNAISPPAPAPTPAPRMVVSDIPSYAAPEYDPDHEAMSLPTPEGVEKYRVKLEDRLLERYNNLPEYAGRVARVRVVLSRPMDISMDGKLIKAEFDQLVYDNWGKRMPDLEKEYYVVTFGSGGVQQVRSDPSIRVGLNMEKAWSEKAPLVSDPFRNVETQEAFRPAPRTKMPSWWRPEFPELD